MSLNETAAAAAPVAAWSADVYARQSVKHADALLGPLARGCVTLLAGPRGVGKSWLALALAHTAARGGTLGAWRARKTQRVVYVDVAGSEAVLHARLLALGPKPPPSLTIVPGDAQTGGLPDLSLESGRTALDQLTTDADLVVIDGLSAMVRKGRGVGTRWAAVEAWLRSLRHRHVAVLLVDAKEPRALADIADAVLKIDRPADGVQEGDLRLQARLLCARPELEGTQRFELRLELRKNGAAWTYVDDLDHRAIVAYRLHNADYSSREIAKMLGVSPATAWRLIDRGERLPAHIREGVDMEVPEAAREGFLLPREKATSIDVAARDSVREDEGPAAPAIGTDAGETDPRGEAGPSPYPLPRERVPESDAAPSVSPPQTAQSGEAVKRPDGGRAGPAPPAGRGRPPPLSRAERMWRTPLHTLMKERGFG